MLHKVKAIKTGILFEEGKKYYAKWVKPQGGHPTLGIFLTKEDKEPRIKLFKETYNHFFEPKSKDIPKPVKK